MSAERACLTSGHDGHPQPMQMIAKSHDLESVARRFWSKVDKTESCWIWRACRERRGYGCFSGLGKCRLAHRVAWMLVHGEWPATGLRHSCDNPSCVNPAHLSLGTHAQNMADMVARGRSYRGERRSALTEDMVREIRRLALEGVSMREIGRRFGIGAPHVCRIKQGKKWAHLWRAT
jgi:hypothetical protein